MLSSRLPRNNWLGFVSNVDSRDHIVRGSFDSIGPARRSRNCHSNETGFRFTAGDFVMLAERILQICDDDELRMKLGQGARKRVESFFKREMQIENLTQLIAKESGSIFMGLERNIRSGENVCAPR